MGSGNNLLMALCSSYPEVCRPRHKSSPSGPRYLPCQDLSSYGAEETNFLTAARSCDLILSIRAAIVGASRTHLFCVRDPVGSHPHSIDGLFQVRTSLYSACTFPSRLGLPGRGK